MRLIRFTCISIVALAISSVVTSAQQDRSSAETLLGKARHQQDVEGNIDAAIATYKAIIGNPNASRTTIATALLRLGQAYERLGSLEARKAYERVARDFADQPQIVAQARGRLAELSAAPDAPRHSGVVARQVWSGPDADIEGRPSSDGRFLTFIDWSTADRGNLAVRDLTTGQNRLITHTTYAEGFAQSPVLSPDAKQIAYVWESTKGQPSELRVIGVDGAKSRTLLRLPGVYPSYLAWSPDAKQIAATLTNYGSDKTSSITLISVADGAMTKLKSTGWRFPEIGGFSSDGRFILYSVDKTDAATLDGGIFALSVDGSVQHTIVQSKALDRSPAWTPDGRGVVFVSDRSGAIDLWFIPTQDAKPTGAPALLRANVGQIQTMGFTRDGLFFYGLRERQRDVYVAGLDPVTLDVSSRAAVLSDQFVGNNALAAWSPDGRYIAFVRTTGPATKSVVVRSVSDGVERTVPVRFEHQYATRFGPTWFPDGKSLLLSDIVGSSRRIVFAKVDIDTGRREELFAGVWQGMWDHVKVSPDGRTLFYTNVTKDKNADMNELHLVRRDLSSGTETEIYRAVSSGVGFFGLSVSPDGSWLAFSANVGPNERTLMTLPATGGVPKVLYRGDYTHPTPQTTVWTKDGRYVLAIFGDGRNRSRVWAFPADGGEPRKLDVTMQGIGSVDLSPDGRLVFTGATNKSEVWTISNLLPHPRGTR